MYSIDQDSKINLLKTAYEQECVEKAKDIAYHIIAMEKSSDDMSEVILESENQIKNILSNVPYSLDQKYINDGIEAIFKRSLEA